MRRLVTILLLSLFTLLTLAGCTPPLTKGYVYDKQYQAAYMQYVPGYYTDDCIPTGKHGKDCTEIYHSGYTIWHPAYYYLDITSCSSLQTSGQCQTGEVEVDQSTYNSYRVGSYYSVGEGGN